MSFAQVVAEAQAAEKAKAEAAAAEEAQQMDEMLEAAAAAAASDQFSGVGMRRQRGATSDSIPVLAHGAGASGAAASPDAIREDEEYRGEGTGEGEGADASDGSTELTPNALRRRNSVGSHSRDQLRSLLRRGMMGAMCTRPARSNIRPPPSLPFPSPSHLS